MFSTVLTIMRGRTERAREQVESDHAVLIVEQKIREAGQGHERSKRALASLILRERTEAKALAALDSRIADLESRTGKALSAGHDSLARDGAEAIADMENERSARRRALDRTRQAVQRLRLLIEKTDRRLVDLRQGLITARAIEAERRSAGEMRGFGGSGSALGEAEAVLQRTLAADDPVEALDILDEINAGLSGDDLVDRMAAEGFGPAEKSRGEDVLARLRAARSDATEQTA